VGAPSLAIQVLGDELDVESLPSCTISQPRRLLLLAGHDLKEHSHSRGLILQIMRSWCQEAPGMHSRFVIGLRFWTFPLAEEQLVPTFARRLQVCDNFLMQLLCRVPIG